MAALAIGCELAPDGGTDGNSLIEGEQPDNSNYQTQGQIFCTMTQLGLQSHLNLVCEFPARGAGWIYSPNLQLVNSCSK
jgi:hypothetical protein